MVKVNLNENENENTVKKFMKDYNKPSELPNLINNDLSTQEQKFRLKLEEKRKNKLSSSYMLEDGTPVK